MNIKYGSWTNLTVRTVEVDRVALAAVVARQHLRERALEFLDQFVGVYERLNGALARRIVRPHVSAERRVDRVFVTTAQSQPRLPPRARAGPTQNRFVRFIQIFKALSCII